jgi:phosphotransferase system enzyme I (PtsI)
MYQPFHPAILRMIQDVVRTARKAGIKVALCGEMAGDPLCVLVLVGLGLDELSMNAQAIPMIKKIIRLISMEEAQADLEDLLQLNMAEAVRKFILKRMKSIVELDEKGLYIKAL